MSTDGTDPGNGVRLAGLDPAQWNDEVRSLLGAALDNVRRANAAGPAVGAPDPPPTGRLPGGGGES